MFKHLTKGREAAYLVSSAGISAMDGFFATDETVRVMRDEGVDVSNHRSKRLTVPMILTADEIFVMESFHRDWIVRNAPEAEGRVHMMTEYLDSGNERGIPDPIRMPDSFYKNTLNIITACVKKIIEKLEEKK